MWLDGTHGLRQHATRRSASRRFDVADGRRRAPEPGGRRRRRRRRHQGDRAAADGRRLQRRVRERQLRRLELDRSPAATARRPRRATRRASGTTAGRLTATANAGLVRIRRARRCRRPDRPDGDAPTCRLPAEGAAGGTVPLLTLNDAGGVARRERRSRSNQNGDQLVAPARRRDVHDHRHVALDHWATLTRAARSRAAPARAPSRSGSTAPQIYRTTTANLGVTGGQDDPARQPHPAGGRSRVVVDDVVADERDRRAAARPALQAAHRRLPQQAAADHRLRRPRRLAVRQPDRRTRLHGGPDRRALDARQPDPGHVRDGRGRRDRRGDEDLGLEDEGLQRRLRSSRRTTPSCCPTATSPSRSASTTAGGSASTTARPGEEVWKHYLSQRPLRPLPHRGPELQHRRARRCSSAAGANQGGRLPPERRPDGRPGR